MLQNAGIETLLKEEEEPSFNIPANSTLVFDPSTLRSGLKCYQSVKLPQPAVGLWGDRFCCWSGNSTRRGHWSRFRFTQPAMLTIMEPVVLGEEARDWPVSTMMVATMVVAATMVD